LNKSTSLVARADGTLETGLIRHHMDPWDTGDPRIDRYDDQDTATSDMPAPAGRESREQ